jgi:hypothetical protein
MIGAVQSTQITAISSMTLALFEDSGWYVADYQVLIRTLMVCFTRMVTPGQR